MFNSRHTVLRLSCDDAWSRVFVICSELKALSKNCLAVEAVLYFCPGRGGM